MSSEKGVPGAQGRPGPPPYSSSVMREVMAQAMDDGYTLAAASTEPEAPRDRRWLVGLVLALVALGLMLTVAAIETERSEAAVAKEKEQLIARIHEETNRVDKLRDRSGALEEEINQLQKGILTRTTNGRRLQERLTTLGILAGTQSVTGPGVRIVVDDAADEMAAANGGRILDIDVQQTVNGLWAAGAEAIAINGQRLSSRTAIRGADKAITVDYRPLARPYTIEAIGDPKTLESRFMEGPGGTWLSTLKVEHQISLDVSTVDELELPPDSGIQLRHVTTEGTQ